MQPMISAVDNDNVSELVSKEMFQRALVMGKVQYLFPI